MSPYRLEWAFEAAGWLICLSIFIEMFLNYHTLQAAFHEEVLPSMLSRCGPQVRERGLSHEALSD